MANKIYVDLVNHYEEFHRNPELSFKEFQTSEKIKNILETNGIEFCGAGKSTGILAELPFDKNGPAILLRSDMDAIPVSEKTGLEYASEKKGIMHACGHDIHMSCLLGALIILSGLQNKPGGFVKGIFQPGEEVMPGGAIDVLEDGILTGPDVKRVFGLHIDPNIPAGKVGIKPGAMMASVAEFKIVIHGKGGHAAFPHKTVDPILMAAEVVNAFQKIVSRMTEPILPAVVSVTEISGGTAYNIIPEYVTLKGTCRALDQNIAQVLEEQIRRILEGVTLSYNGHYEMDYDEGPPVLVNDTEVSLWVREKAVEYLGRENVLDVEGVMGGEDFAYFLQKVPGCFFRLGVGNEDTAGFDLHSPYLTPDPESIKTGSGLLAYLAKESITDMGKQK